MQPVFVSTWNFGKLCVECADRKWAETGSLLDSVETGIAAVELDPSVNSVGYGGFPNAEGEVELDAALMLGSTMVAGAVAGMRNIVPAISVARRVMEQTPHIMLVGPPAQQFARENGFKARPLLTEYTLQRWREWSHAPTGPEVLWSEQPHDSHDTVCLLGWHNGDMVAGCATSGVAWKLSGRVGDSPILGAGLYADNEAGAAAATGLGEEIWRFLLSHAIVEAMRMGSSPQDACDEALETMLRRKPANRDAQCAVIAIDKLGRTGAASTKPGFSSPAMVNGEFQPNEVTPLQ